MSKLDSISLLERWNAQVERCGFVLLDGEVVEVTNSHPDPASGFRMAAEDWERYRTLIAATWHTHPRTGANLSMVDYCLFLSQPEWAHYVVSRDTVRCYYVEGGKVLLYEND